MASPTSSVRSRYLFMWSLLGKYGAHARFKGGFAQIGRHWLRRGRGEHRCRYRAASLVLRPETLCGGPYQSRAGRVARARPIQDLGPEFGRGKAYQSFACHVCIIIYAFFAKGDVKFGGQRACGGQILAKLRRLGFGNAGEYGRFGSVRLDAVEFPGKADRPARFRRRYGVEELIRCRSAICPRIGSPSILPRARPMAERRGCGVSDDEVRLVEECPPRFEEAGCKRFHDGHIGHGGHKPSVGIEGAEIGCGRLGGNKAAGDINPLRLAILTQESSVGIVAEGGEERCRKAKPRAVFGDVASDPTRGAKNSPRLGIPGDEG